MEYLTDIPLCVCKREWGSLMKQHMWKKYIEQVDKQTLCA